MYLNQNEVKALKNLLGTGGNTNTTMILRTALNQNDAKVQRQRKIIADMLQMPKNNMLKFI